MSSKLVLQDLVDLLAKKSKITKKEADSFFREFFQIILDSIFNNDSVKIKDFGTFKLVSVSSRESVDVNTGAKIQIRAHYKLSFVPDKTLKNLVNKPFSQFETILLEDNADPYVDNNEDIVDNEEEKEYEIDMSSISDNEKLVRKPNFTSLNDDTSEQNIEKEKEENKSLDKKEDNVNLPDKTNDDSISFQYPSYNTSYVYTYTTSSSKDNPDSESITLTIPQGSNVGKMQNEIPKEDVSNLLDETIDQIRSKASLRSQPAASVIENPVDNELLDDDHSDEIVEQEVVQSEDRKKHYIEPIIPQKDDNEPLIEDNDSLLLDDDSEIEMEEDVIIPVNQIPARNNKEVKGSVNEVKLNTQDSNKDIDVYTNNAERKKFSVEDPERPLLPEDDDVITEDDFVEIANDDPSVVAHPVPANNLSNKPATIRSVAYTETIDDIDIPYHDYYAPTLGSKIKKALPWTILGIVVLGFLIYNLIPMLHIRYDFENKIDRLNLSVSDTLPMVDRDEPESEVLATADSSVVINAYDIKDAPSQDMQQSKNKGSKEHATPDRKISDNLQISTINKAQEYLQLYPPKKEEFVKDTTQDVRQMSNTNPRYDTIKRGVTLRNLATKYYGNGDYWVYIYQSNARKIRNPNSIPIGTTLVIPQLSQYGINNPQDYREIQKAKNMADRILR